LFACSQSTNTAHSYLLGLFKNTPNWELAKAVDAEDTSEIKRLIQSGSQYNLNMQEPKLGETLLHLAIWNGKYFSLKTLLENKANINIKNSNRQTPILEAAKLAGVNKQISKIIELLIKYGANTNDTIIQMHEQDTVNIYTPLAYATSDIQSVKILLDAGADPYIKYNHIYSVWYHLWLNNFENIFVARYLIVEKKMPIPNPIALSLIKKIPQDIYFFLDKYNPHNDLAKQKAKQEILDYLHSISFPNKQVYIK
jgi:ankyrin repeat protein